tara:strand:- start:84 stop:374 length:291 start_codon:yes stop_codon:yes gene_type:complete
MPGRVVNRIQSLTKTQSFKTLTGSDSTGDAERLGGIRKVYVTLASGKGASNILRVRLKGNSRFVDFSGMREGFPYPLEIEFLASTGNTVTSVIASR